MTGVLALLFLLLFLLPQVRDEFSIVHGGQKGAILEKLEHSKFDWQKR
jgi:hypothetical protein